MLNDIGIKFAVTSIGHRAITTTTVKVRATASLAPLTRTALEDLIYNAATFTIVPTNNAARRTEEESGTVTT